MLKTVAKIPVRDISWEYCLSMELVWLNNILFKFILKPKCNISKLTKTNFAFNIMKILLFTNVYHNLEGKGLVVVQWWKQVSMVLQVKKKGWLFWNQEINFAL